MIAHYGYMNIFLSIAILGFGIDMAVHLVRQMKKPGKWELDYNHLATYIIGGMFIMSYFTYVFRSEIELFMYISLWLLLPGYSLLRSLKKHS